MRFENYIQIFKFLFIISLTSCATPSVEPVKQQSDTMKEQFIAVNRYWLAKEKILIDEFAKQNNYNLMQTETGLRYKILKKGYGKKVNSNSTVLLAYKLKLIDGTLCYSSDSTGYKEITIGKSVAERGLEEGLRILSEGDSAIFIIPSHLAYGIIGDGNCIPSRAILVYNLKLIKIVNGLKNN